MGVPNQWRMKDLFEGENPYETYPHEAWIDPATLENGTRVNHTISVTGRVTAKRGQGKLVFYDLRADGYKLQIMSDISTYLKPEFDAGRVNEEERAHRFTVSHLF